MTGGLPYSDISDSESVSQKSLIEATLINVLVPVLCSREVHKHDITTYKAILRISMISSGEEILTQTLDETLRWTLKNI